MGARHSALLQEVGDEVRPGVPDSESAEVITVGERNQREHQLFRSVDHDNDGVVQRREFDQLLTAVGLRHSDARLAESMAALDALSNATDRTSTGITREQFCAAIRPNILLIERALQGNMVIPDFEEFCAEVRDIYEKARENRDGSPADYIPQLNLAEPEADQFGVALCSIDGQRFALGEADRFFSVQSSCKPIIYCMALEEHGPAKVHAHVGHEPSGAGFNELTLDKLGRPHNPLINAGAIMCSSLIGLNERQARSRSGDLSSLDVRGWAGTRFEHVMARWQALCGGETPRFSSSVYLSERETADRNFALAYYMREKGTFPEDVDLADVLDFYFQSCSIEVTTDMMSVVAATLANGGICPVTGERIFTTETVRHCLSLMSSCGMYDYSGEFAFTIGLPAKSGVSGVMLLVVPNVMGLCLWSPRLDTLGNSVRGLEFSRHLVERFSLHNYDNLSGSSKKRDPRLGRVERVASQINKLIWAASKGDLGAIQHQLSRGADLMAADYDRRTPLHLAAAEGQLRVVEYFVERHGAGDDCLDLSPKDRWDGTPLDDAYFHDHPRIIELLTRAGARRGSVRRLETRRERLADVAQGADADPSVELIWAASQGNLACVRRLVARGMRLDIGDYDHRTPLHLAAAEGQLPMVAYLLAQGVDANPRDRWGNTPLSEARRHSRHAVEQALLDAGAVQ